MLRVLLTGASGYLGHWLAPLLEIHPGVELVTAGRGRESDVPLYLDDAKAVRLALEVVAPDMILNAAACSRMSECEADPDLARRINVEAVRALASTGARLLQVSTDLVFDGTRAPYSSSDPPSPVSVYGRTKADGESAAAGPDNLVVRLPLLFGPSFDGKRGATDMIRAGLDAGRPMHLYDNEYRTPLHVADAAQALVGLLLDASETGIVHLAGADRLSRYELALRFCQAAGVQLVDCHAVDCSSPLRPPDVSLVGRKAATPLDLALASC